MFDTDIHNNFLSSVRLATEINEYIELYINKYKNEDYYILLMKYCIDIGIMKSKLSDYYSNYKSLTRFSILTRPNYKLISSYEQGIKFIENLMSYIENYKTSNPFEDSDLSIITRCSSISEMSSNLTINSDNMYPIDRTLPLNNLYYFNDNIKYDNNEFDFTLINTELEDNMEKCLGKYLDIRKN